MSTTITFLSNSLPSSIPKLDATGLNWAIFSVCFKDTIKVKGFWGHFNGTSICLQLITVTAPNGAVTSAPTAAEIASQAQWQKDKRLAKSLLIQKILDSMLMCIHLKTSVKDHWYAIVAEYSKKGAYTQTDLHTKFLELKCLDKANVCKFLDSLQVKREKLITVSVMISDKDYISTIISSLPYALSNFRLVQLALAWMFAPTRTIKANGLLSLLAEEADHQKVQ
ncbi:hypothetical protein NLJ89_g11326 [Agrocybe chaxingu]|uniref:Uncharacterized protein n=1 Tax=Agrocybe chaxingu TaxID=84603 RepID=A0A9W8JPF3_9AGAR|nr:hypothetical protein NLJ89_g11326 [Agrocybe chaxingu]